MNKLLILVCTVAALVVANVSADYHGGCNRCHERRTCHKPCVKKCVEAPKVCRTTYNEGAIPACKCVKEIEVESPCNLEKVVTTEYVCSCPPGYHQIGQITNIRDGYTTQSEATMKK